MVQPGPPPPAQIRYNVGLSLKRADALQRLKHLGGKKPVDMGKVTSQSYEKKLAGTTLCEAQSRKKDEPRAEGFRASREYDHGKILCFNSLFCRHYINFLKNQIECQSVAKNVEFWQ